MKRLLLFVSGTLLIFSSVQSQTLVGSYSFTGNANDASGSGNNGTVNGAALTSDRLGNANKAYSFNGTSNSISIPNNASLALTTNFSVSAWIKTNSLPSVSNAPGGNAIAGKDEGPGTNNPKWIFILQNGNLAFHINGPGLGSGAWVYSNSFALTTTQWYYCTMLKSGNNVSFYVNGNNLGTFTLSSSLVTNPNAPVTIGNSEINTAFDGGIDEVKIYNNSISSQQVFSDYESGSLVADYPFNGNANDASGNGNNGVVNGATLSTDRFGNANSAYNFNGISDFIQVPNSTSLQLSNSYTLIGWVNANGYFSSNCQANFIISKGIDQSAEGGYNLQYGDFLDGSCGAYTPSLENFATTIRKGGSSFSAYTTTPTTPVLSKWYMVAATYDGTTLKLFLNGVMIASQATSGSFSTLNTEDLFIGKHNSGGAAYLVNGLLDDLKLYNVVLPNTQIFDTYINDLKKPGSGNGIQLTGTGSLATSPYINLGTGFDFGSQPFTYETWMKRDVITTTQNNYGKGLLIGDNDNAWGIGIANDNTLFLTKVGINFVSSTATIADTKWHHVAVVYTGTQVQFYIDGVAAGSPAYTDNFSNTSGNYFIGARQSFGNSNGDQTLDGKIDETRIWRNVALTQTQIRNWMCRKVTSSHPAYANLYAYYRFDEGSGTTAYAAGGHPGTLLNSPVWLISGASLGDATANDYVSATKSATLSASTGETFTATETSGAPTGIQVYRVDAVPNTVAGTNTGGNNKYFGVFQAGGTTPAYSAVYNYTGNTAVTASNESNLRLFKRVDNSVTTWTDCNAVQDMNANTLTATGQSTEYILGSNALPLPVQLINFKGAKDGSATKLQWTTSNETGLDHFDIERSEDGRNFLPMQKVFARGSSTENRYDAFDPHPLREKNYYRLKMVDADGKYGYSQVIMIDFSGKMLVSLYPNPTSGMIRLYSDATILALDITDAGGRTVKHLTPRSDNIYSVTELEKGIYFIRFTTGTGTGTMKFSKL